MQRGESSGDMQHCAAVPVPCELLLVPGFLFVLCLLPDHTWLTPAGSQWDGMGMKWFVLVSQETFSVLWKTSQLKTPNLTFTFILFVHIH